jgi:hypothetical protein
MKKPHNAVKGEFAKPGETDWAVLCSVMQTPRLFPLRNDSHYVSSILVFWNGSERTRLRSRRRKTVSSFKGSQPTRLGFPGPTGTAGKEFIMHYYRAYGGPTPPPINHEGSEARTTSMWPASS